MRKIVKKSFDAPDEIRSFEKSKIEVVKLVCRVFTIRFRLNPNRAPANAGRPQKEF
jgi:hypothetical protein